GGLRLRARGQPPLPCADRPEPLAEGLAAEPLVGLHALPPRRVVDRALRVVDRGLRLAVRAFPWALGIVFFAPAFFVASLVPYRAYDSLAFGTWSRLIADRGHLWFPNDLFDSQAGRPLFYVGQGLVWLAFGYHDWLGPWFSGL